MLVKENKVKKKIADENSDNNSEQYSLKEKNFNQSSLVFSKKEIAAIYQKSFFELLFQAQQQHRKYHDYQKIQISTLVSIKTGGCPEDCSYCSQSSHYETKLKKTDWMNADEILEQAREAKANGSTRLCMGAAGTSIKDGKTFDRVLRVIKQIKEELNLQTCLTMGMLNQEQANRLKEAGLDYYNHNIDTSPEHYKNIVSTRTFEERIATLEKVACAGINTCTGGILGLGENRKDRISFLHSLHRMQPRPNSITINKLVPIPGTPLENNKMVDHFEIIRTIATARIIMPAAIIRLSAGRESMSEEMQTLCFLAGANSIFSGEKLLTTPNAGTDKDRQLLKKIDMSPTDFLGNL